MDSTKAAFGANDLNKLAQAVFVQGTAYEVDRSVIESLMAKGLHRERSYQRVGTAQVIHPGDLTIVVAVTIRVDGDVDVGDHGERIVQFPPQTLRLEYTFTREGTGDFRLGQACQAGAASSQGGESGFPTPLGTPLTGVAPGVHPSPAALPTVIVGAAQTPPPMAGPCDMTAFPF
ncbi:MAG: hypothetical protein ACREQ5_16315 [Candidatus Dormibacteria bacterium]